MIVFHEGLPGAGKSYEAMVVRIIPAMKKGRQVVCYVEGIEYAKVAELVGIPEDKARELLISLTRDQMQNWLSHCKDNALMVFDEAQNFWGNKAKLSAQETQLITEHRHRGMDIVLMGQDLRDVHATWRRRVELKLSFLKLNGLGLSSRYSVTTYRHLGADSFVKTGLSVRKYDPAYFGTYASLVADDTNTEVYSDKRAQLWNHWGFKLGAPLLILAAVFGVRSIWKFFHAEPVASVSAKAEVRPGAFVPLVAALPSASAPVAAVAPGASADVRSPTERRLADLSGKYRIRLAGMISSGERFDGYIEWVDGGSRVMERMSLNVLRTMGVGLARSDGFVKLAVGAWSEIATMWPTESEGKVSGERLEAIRPQRTAYQSPSGFAFEPARVDTQQESPGTLQQRLAPFNRQK